jgi:DNA modification methylase
MNQILQGDCLEVLKTLEPESIDCCITSPPYWGLRDYGTAKWEGGNKKCGHLMLLQTTRGGSKSTLTSVGAKEAVNANTTETHKQQYKDICPKCGAKRIDSQLGLEKTPEEYVENMVKVFQEVKRVLKKGGVMFLNLGDSYYGSGKGQTNEGSNDPKQPKLKGMKLPLHGRHDGGHDNDDKGEQGSQNRGSSSQNQSDEHKDISDHRNPDILCPVHGQVPEPSEKNQVRKQDQNDHLPNEDFSQDENHISFAKKGQEHFSSHDDELSFSSQKSKQKQFSQQRQVRNRQSDNSSSSQDEADEKNPDIPVSSDKKVCICDIVKRLDASDRRKLGSVFSEKAYPYSTTTNLKPKDLVGIPWRVAFALQADGWYLRQDIIWHKPNPMPESVTDRCTKSHEYIFLLSKSPKYYFNQITEELVENSDMAYRRIIRAGRKYGVKRPYKDNQPLSYENTKADKNATSKNRRSVWTVTTKPFKESHFATFPEDLIIPMVLAGCPEKGVVLDCFMGAGTTAVVAKKNGRNYLGVELNPEYIKIAEKRIDGVTFPMF